MWKNFKGEYEIQSVVQRGQRQGEEMTKGSREVFPGKVDGREEDQEARNKLLWAPQLEYMSL